MSSENDAAEVDFPLEEGEAVEPSDVPPGNGSAPEQQGVDEALEEAPGEESETAEELRERWHRAMAELDNLRKRHVRELERERTAERVRTAAALLPVIDHLELALEHAEADPSSVVEGVRAVRDQAVGAFEQLGFPRHDETGVPFDPSLHEAVAVVEDSGAGPGVVDQVLRPGYGDDGRQLRPAAVTVTAHQE